MRNNVRGSRSKAIAWFNSLSTVTRRMMVKEGILSQGIIGMRELSNLYLAYGPTK